MVTVKKFVSATNDAFDETRFSYVYMSKAMIKIAINSSMTVKSLFVH
jgi:hypothetical protein